MLSFAAKEEEEDDDACSADWKFKFIAAKLIRIERYSFDLNHYGQRCDIWAALKLSDKNLAVPHFSNKSSKFLSNKFSVLRIELNVFPGVTFVCSKI